MVPSFPHSAEVSSMRFRPLPLALTFGLTAAACTSGDSASVIEPTSPPAAASPVTTSLDVRSDESFPDGRCDANRDAGTITFFTGYDLAAAASILNVIVASDAGYYDDLCLDVEIVPSIAARNYDAVADGAAHFASGGSFSDLVSYTVDTDVDLVAATVEGRTALDTLIVEAGEATRLADLEGATLGVQGILPPAVDVMLRDAGLEAGDDYDIVQVDGVDPVENLAAGDIVGLPGWKSSEVGMLDRAGVGIAEFDPLDFGVPGSFGLIFTSAGFVSEHPTAAEDFVRATLRGLNDAVADPETAARLAVQMILENGNPHGLSSDGELFRWETEAALILDGTPEGLGLGMPDPEVLQAELDAYDELGLFAGSSPEVGDFIADELTADLYGADEDLVWPA